MIISFLQSKQFLVVYHEVSSHGFVQVMNEGERNVVKGLVGPHVCVQDVVSLSVDGFVP